MQEMYSVKKIRHIIKNNIVRHVFYPKVSRGNGVAFAESGAILGEDGLAILGEDGTAILEE